MASKDFKAYVLALLRAKLYTSVVTECSGELSRRGKAVWIVGRRNCARQQLSTFASKLGSAAALAHKQQLLTPQYHA